MNASNLRRRMQWIIRRAGMKPWPKLYQNLRSTRETALAERFPMHVVCAWIGNTPAIAAKHYLQVTDEHFASALQNPVQQPAATSSKVPPAPVGALVEGLELRGVTAPCDYSQEGPVVTL